MGAGKSPAFSFYPKDYESDECVKLMSLEQEGAYLRLLCHAWLEGSIPADVPSLAAICRVKPSKMAKLWPGIARCWTEKDGRFFNGRQEREREKQRAFSRKNVENGRKGGRPRNPTVSSGLPKRKPRKSVPFPFPSSSATNEQRTTEGADAPPMATDWSREATDDYREAYKADPKPWFFGQVKPIAKEHGWGKTRPALQAYMRETPIELLNISKVLPVRIMGGHSITTATALMRAGPQARPPTTAGEKSVQAAARYLERRSGGGDG